MKHLGTRSTGKDVAGQDQLTQTATIAQLVSGAQAGTLIAGTPYWLSDLQCAATASGGSDYELIGSGGDALAEWLAAGNGTTLTANGAAALVITGTATAANAATTNQLTMLRRLEALVTVAATTAVAGWRAAAALWSVGGAAAGVGGFRCVMTGGPATGVATATSRFFLGLSNSIAAPTDVEPSSITNSIGVGYDAADTNLQLMVRGAGAVSKIDLGASFAVPTADRAVVYRLEMYSPAGSTQSLTYRVKNLANNAVASGTITTNLPTTATLLAPRIWSSVGGTSAVIGVVMGLVRISSKA